MILANLRDGQTRKFDLQTDAGLADWRRCQADPAFQSLITGLSILRDKQTHALPVPGGFRALAFRAELLTAPDGAAAGELIACQADDVQVSITLYFKASPKLARTDLRRTGKPRFVPAGLTLPQKSNGR